MRGRRAVAHKEPQKEPQYSNGPRDVEDRGPPAIKAILAEQGREKKGDNATYVRTCKMEGGREGGGEREREREREREWGGGGMGGERRSINYIHGYWLKIAQLFTRI